MSTFLLTRHALNKSKMKYHEKFGHTLGRIEHIALMSRIDIYYTTCCLENQTVAPTLNGFQGSKRCVQYLASHPHKTIFYPSNYYYGPNVIILTQSGNQVEGNTIQNFLEHHQDADDYRILNRGLSVSGILHTLIGAAKKI